MSKLLYLGKVSFPRGALATPRRGTSSPREGGVVPSYSASTTPDPTTPPSKRSKDSPGRSNAWGASATRNRIRARVRRSGSGCPTSSSTMDHATRGQSAANVAKRATVEYPLDGTLLRPPRSPCDLDGDARFHRPATRRTLRIWGFVGQTSSPYVVPLTVVCSGGGCARRSRRTQPT